MPQSCTGAKTSSNNILNKGKEIKDNPVNFANFIFLEFMFLPLNQSVMSVWSKHFRLSLNA